MYIYVYIYTYIFYKYILKIFLWKWAVSQNYALFTLMLQIPWDRYSPTQRYLFSLVFPQLGRNKEIKTLDLFLCPSPRHGGMRPIFSRLTNFSKLKMFPIVICPNQNVAYERTSCCNITSSISLNKFINA